MSRVVPYPRTQAVCCVLAAAIFAWTAITYYDGLYIWLSSIPVVLMLIAAVTFWRAANRPSPGA